jgi:hypothetical protein
MSEPHLRPQISPLAMSLEDAARLLSKVSGQAIEPDMLAEDIAEGAPCNPDGSVNLVQYGAWLVKEMATRAN